MVNIKPKNIAIGKSGDQIMKWIHIFSSICEIFKRTRAHTGQKKSKSKNHLDTMGKTDKG